ncbi:MAG: hypothetical protein HQL05_11215 [Nitrospirae bacterium]|uniref:hypothetical protein n=1 Tax=Candidatus Magnetobacterium casense TaxID=1455061 RepID=UPI000590E5B0|nr:hypothetical protein [Candidatus Magnetobacterium casensis]MBF0338390.1 hypothetical protein [Nitrospirota bacterium]
MKAVFNQRGEGPLMPILSIAFVGFLCYVGYLFGMPYYKYDSLKSEVTQIARLGGTQQKTLEMVYDKVIDLGLEPLLKKEHIEVKIDNKRINVKAGWTEHVDVLGFYQKDLDFKLDVTQ